MADLFLFHHFNLRVQTFPCVQGVQDLQQFLFAQARRQTQAGQQGAAAVGAVGRTGDAPLV